MRLGVPQQHTDHERRTPITPDTVADYREWGWEVVFEPGVGVPSGITDDALIDAGATVVSSAWDSDLVLVVSPPTTDQIASMQPGAVVVGFLEPFSARDVLKALCDQDVAGLALEAVPRTTLAQAMDALSSQANIAGYASVMLGASTMARLFPMMVTAAGTIPPARTLVLGVGVAGLQAIATAKRLGSAVWAYDIRPETKEQVESLGAKFVEAVTGEGDSGGYAVEVDEETQRRQQEALAQHVAAADLLITTAQIPGRTAPRLVEAGVVQQMKPGSVVIDMAADSGGNVEGSVPDATVDIGGVTVLGPTNLPSMYATDASRMLARNNLALLDRIRTTAGDTLLDLEDEIIGETTVVVGGAPRHPRTVALLETEAGERS